MRILLGGLTYETGARPIVPFGIEPFGNVVRETGLQRRSDFQVYNRVAYNDWSKGIGYSRARRDTGFGIGGLRDADAETRFDDGIRLPLLNQDATEPTSLEITRFALEFNGAVFTFGERQAASAAMYISAAFTPSTWGTSTSITTVGTPQASSMMMDAIVHKNRIYVLYSTDPTPVSKVSRSTNVGATTWETPLNNIPDNTTRTGASNSNTPLGVLLEFNNVLYSFIYDDTNRRVRCYKTSDEGATAWTAVSNFSSQEGARGRAVWYDLQGDPAPVVGSAEGVWALKDSANVFQLIFPMPFNTDNCRLLIARGQKLYVSAGNGEIYELTLSDVKNITFKAIGPYRFGGLPTAKLGAVSGWAALSPRWLFVAYGGLAASRQASILAYDFEHDAWHSVYYHATGNQRIMWLYLSDRDDGTMRLHFAVRTGSATSDQRFIVNPLLSQSSSGPLPRETDGYVEFPEDDFGDPHETGVLYRALVDASELSAATTGEYLVFLFGRNLTGAAAGAYTDNNVGNFVSGTLTLDPSTNTTFRTLLPRIELNRAAGVNTNTPILKELELRVEKVLNTLVGYIVPIDFDKTAMLNERRPAEAVLTDLLAAVRSTTLVAFQWGNEASVNVMVRLMNQGGFNASEAGEIDLGSFKEGITYVQVIEVLR